MRTMIPWFSRPGLLKGATLIEVMVALVVMSIGLLGLASLQLSGVKTNNNSEKRTQAAILSNDLVERMRANPDEVNQNYAYVAALTNPNFNCANPPASACEDSGSTAATDCTPSAITGFDAYTAWCDAKALLPNGNITVVCSDATGVAQACSPTSYRTITVTWNNQTENGFTPKSLTTTFRP